MKDGRAQRFLAAIAAHPRRRHEWYWVPLLYAAALVYLYRAVFFPGDGPAQGLGWDTIEAYWADLAYFAGQLRAGEWPLWNPYERGGFPDSGIPERATYYPVTWLFGGWGAAVGEVSWWLIQLKGFAHHLIAACMMHLYLRSRGLPRAASLVGGMAWLGSAPLLIHKASSVIWPLVWVPLVWLAIDKLAERPSWRRGAALAAALGLAGNAGSAPGFFYALLLAVPYGAVRLTQALVAARIGGGREVAVQARRLGLAIGIAAALTVALMLVWVVPSMELTSMSQRAERSLAYAQQYPLEVVPTLVGALAPNPGRYDLYLGVTVLALALCGLVMAPWRDRGTPLVLGACAVFFTVLSFGSATPVLEWLVKHVPGFDMFRVSNRYKLLVAPLIAALAGFGAAGLMQAARGFNRRTVTALAVCIAVLATTIAVLTHFPLPAKHRPMPAEWLPFALAALAYSLIVATAAVPRRWAAVPLIFAAGLALWEPQHYVHFTNKALEPEVDHLEDRAWLDGLEDVERTWRIYDEFVMEQRAGSRLRVREFRSYPAGGSLEPQRYQRVIRYAKRNPEILQVYSIRYVLHGRHHRAGLGPNHFKKPLDKLSPTHFVRRITPHCETTRNPAACPVFEALHPVPPVAWYGAAEVEPRGGGPELDILRRQIDGPGELRVVALEPEAARALDPGLLAALTAARESAPPSVAGRIETLTANSLIARIDAPAAGIVVINDTMYPGWNAYVDGRPARGFYANHLVRGIAVEPGPHTIEWRYEPAYHRPLRWLYLAALLVLLAAALWPRRRQKTV